MSNLFILIIEFFKTGLFAIGGGLSTIPFLKEISINYNFYTLQDLSTMIIVAESTPGPIGVNMASFVGFKMYNIFGAIITTISLVTPSIICICLIYKVLEKFKNSSIVNSMFMVIRPAVTGIILSVVIPIVINSFKFKAFDSLNYKIILIYIILIFLKVIFKKKIGPILTIGLGIILGILLNTSI